MCLCFSWGGIGVTLTIERLEFYRKHPTLAARDLLGVRLHWTQRQMLRAAFGSTNCLWLACRSLGKTWLIAVYLCLKCILFPKMRCGVFASCYNQACFTFEKLQQLWDDSPFLQAVTTGPPKVTKNKAELVFINKSRIEAYAVKRGARFNQVVIDEYRDLPPEQLAVIKPYLLAKHVTEKNHMLIASTATYQTNHFYAKYKEFEEQVQKGNPRYALTSFDIDDALSGPFTFIDKDAVESIKEDLLPEEIDQELYCKFTNLRDGFFAGALIKSCELAFKPIKSCDGYITVLGIDVGRVKGGDNSAFTVCQLIPGEGVRVVHVLTVNGATMDEQRMIIGRLVRDFNISKIVMDNEKLGYALRDSLMKPSLDEETNKVLPPIVLEDDFSVPGALQLIIGQNFANKTEMWERVWDVKKAMQERILYFPEDKYRIMIGKDNPNIDSDEMELIDMYYEIAALKREMSNMEIKQTETNTAFSLVPGTGAKIKDDRFWSMILSASEAVRMYKESLENNDDSYVGSWA